VLETKIRQDRQTRQRSQHSKPRGSWEDTQDRKWEEEEEEGGGGEKEYRDFSSGVRSGHSFSLRGIFLFSLTSKNPEKK